MISIQQHQMVFCQKSGPMMASGIPRVHMNTVLGKPNTGLMTDRIVEVCFQQMMTVLGKSARLRIAENTLYTVNIIQLPQFGRGK